MTKNRKKIIELCEADKQIEFLFVWLTGKGDTGPMAIMILPFIFVKGFRYLKR